MDILAYNREAWDRNVDKGDRWTVPVSAAQIAAARLGDWSVIITPNKPVPRSWFPDLLDLKVLALASGGGQQGPLLAAAGARVTVFDNSPRQLEQDCFVAERDGLSLNTVQGDMADLSAFASESFDLILHPCSNCFVPDVRKVWREAFRVLRKGGALLSGFTDPVMSAIDTELAAEGIAQLVHTIPYSDETSLPDEQRRLYTDRGEPLVFGHSLEDQLGGQLDAGFVIAGFFSDRHVGEDAVSKYMDGFHATRAIKP